MATTDENDAAIARHEQMRTAGSDAFDTDLEVWRHEKADLAQIATQLPECDWDDTAIAEWLQVIGIEATTDDLDNFRQAYCEAQTIWGQELS